MVEQTPVNEPEPKPDEPRPADEPPAALSTNVQGDGPPDGFGLSGAGGGTGSEGQRQAAAPLCSVRRRKGK